MALFQNPRICPEFCELIVFGRKLKAIMKRINADRSYFCQNNSDLKEFAFNHRLELAGQVY